MASTKPSIFIVSGTRPEVIKLAPVYKYFKQQGELNVYWLSSGQHKDMLEQAHNVFDISPDFDLALMKENQTPLDIVSAGSKSMAEIFKSYSASMVIVQGDTATGFAAALAAFYSRIPVAHIEAGLRSYRIDEPFPEESHRRMIASMTSLHFPPTIGAAENLYKEGIAKESVFVVGNTVIDTLVRMPVNENLDFLNNIPRGKKWVTVTAHRRENHGERLKSICAAVQDISAIDDVEVLFPVHPNPNVREVVYSMLDGRENIHLLPPMDYFDFVHLMRESYLILTDSGGVQEEAPSFKKPVLVLRNQTERPEAVNAGMAKLVGNEQENISREAIKLLTDNNVYSLMQQGDNPFGNGNSSELIYNEIIKYLRANNV